MTTDLSLTAAKNLFLNRSAKTINAILEKEKYNLRNRSMKLPAPQTWADTDDSEDYMPTASMAAHSAPVLSKKKNAPKKRRKKKAESDDAAAGSSASESADRVTTDNSFVASLPMLLDNDGEEGEGQDMMEVDVAEGAGSLQVAETEKENIAKDNEGVVEGNVAVDDSSALATDDQPLAELERSTIKGGAEGTEEGNPALARSPAPREIEAKEEIKRQSTPPPVSQEEAEIMTPVVNPGTKEVEEATPEPTTLEISTSFAHPITFNHIPNEDGSDPCHFCSDFAYGIVGLGKRVVEVVDLGDGRYDEIRNGHSQDGRQPSRVCSNCVQRRLRVVKCSSHHALPLQGVSPESFDFRAAYDSLIPVVGQKRSAKNPWCSLCPTPAFFQCRCGLMLCEECEIIERALGGDLSRVVAMIQTNDEDGTRADVEFILPGSQLEKQHAS
ncbi:hypothetical protein BJY01DRAFT_224287 [Aspergillus pseudoustus]|uniref:B box-type domain-containing protein n=1 Tax=Aspergillus pseudoustus TaxID=1810923 RepID=A0ABR4J3R4_9EURO